MTQFFTQLDGNNQVKVEHEGFVITARIMEDDDAELSWLGEFANTPAARFAIPHEPHNHRTFNWFNAENVENDEQAQENYRRACAYGESWVMQGVVVHVTHKGVKLATDSLWGIESDSDAEYFVQTANELAENALALAREKLAELREGA